MDSIQYDTMYMCQYNTDVKEKMKESLRKLSQEEIPDNLIISEQDPIPKSWIKGISQLDYNNNNRATINIASVGRRLAYNRYFLVTA